MRISVNGKKRHKEIIKPTPKCQLCETHEHSFAELYDAKLELETEEWDYYNDTYVKISMDVNYCPLCGRNLKE